MPPEQSANGYLFDLYRRYIGEPEGRTDVYVGFGCFFGGIGIAITALVLFLWGSRYDVHTWTYYAWIEPSYMLGMLSLPAMMLGIVVLLPSERRMLYASIGGALITAIAVSGFLYAYPKYWHFVRDVDYTVEVVATYAVGLSGLIASTGAALVAHYLDLAQRAEAAKTDADAEDDDEDDLSDVDVQQDIDEAMEDVEVSWGGVEKTEHKRLNFSENEFDGVTVNTSAGTKTARSTGVDAQVDGLKGLKGGETKTTTSSSSVDDQTAKLRELREKQREEAAADDDESSSRTSVSTLLEQLRAFVSRK